MTYSHGLFDGFGISTAGKLAAVEECLSFGMSHA
jgi:hypothetical protein